MRRVELLSPAKNVDVAIAAINNGADAVYIGGPAFGARKAVGNSLEDIEKAVRYAHRFYCPGVCHVEHDSLRRGVTGGGTFDSWPVQDRSGCYYRARIRLY